MHQTGLSACAGSAVAVVVWMVLERIENSMDASHQIKAHVLSKCPKSSRAAFAAAFSPAKARGRQAPVGLILSERYVNLPNEVAPWLQKALLSEIRSALFATTLPMGHSAAWHVTVWLGYVCASWAWEDEPTQARRDSFKFGAYLILTRAAAKNDTTEDANDSNLVHFALHLLIAIR